MDQQQQCGFTFLQNEISQWEHAINSQPADHHDPLELHFRYICWLESHIKTHQGIDERFRKAVEACLTFFDKHEHYKQDLRFVKLWIKYIDFQPNPLNMYKILYQKGIGTKCAAFYNGWAHYYNSSNQFKQAESIYNMGIQLKAEPIGELEQAQKNFRFSVAQRMLYNDESSKKRTISSLAEQREQITSLSPHQQNCNPAKRTKLDEYATGGGYNYQNQGYPCTSGEVMPQGGYVQQQNYNNHQQQPQPQPIQEIKYTFEHGFQSPSNFYNYAQNSHEQWDAPLTLDEPFEPNQCVYYPKSRVYPGNNQEYSLEELKTHKWRMMAEEKRKREHEAEQLRIKQEQERLRQEAEAKRLLAEQERIRKEQEQQKQLQLKQQHQQMQEKQQQLKLQQQQQQQQLQEKQQQLQLQQQQNYQKQQQQQQQYHHHQTWNQPQQPAANYQSYPQPPQAQPIPPVPPTYQNSPQYSYVHDHMYQSHNSYQSSPQQAYQNSPSYHANPQAYNHQNYNYQQSQPAPGYQSSPLIHQNYQQSPQQSYVGSPHTQSSYSNSPQIHPVQNHYQPAVQTHNNFQSPQISQNYGNHANQSHYYSTNHYPAQYQSYNQPQQPTQSHQSYPSAQPPQQHAMYDNNQQNYTNNQANDGYQVEYLISDQNEIDPNMLQQPIVENKQPDPAETKPIVQSYMLDDLEDQIEASTIRFSSDGVSRDKKLTIKFRKEKSTNLMKIVNSDQSSCELKDPLELPATTPKRKSKKNLVNDMLDDSTQFMPSATNSSSSQANPGEYDTFSGKLNFNGCVTPGRKPSSKLSTPVSTFKSLRKADSVRSQNDDSVCSFNGEQNSFFQAENDEEFRGKRLENALTTIAEHMKKEKIDPFHAELCRAFLVKLNFPNRDCKDYQISNSNLPKLIKNQTGHYAGVAYHIEKEVGRGAFGAVFRGVNMTDNNVVALKYQKPPNSWELYICTEVRNRLKNPDILPGFMSISAAVLAPNASVLVSEFSQYGSLLDINNKVRQATTKVMHESLVMHFTSQILNIVHYLHSCKIIHADIKPDNFLLMTLPSADTWVPSIRLIDFGCAIDMTLFNEGTEFYKIIQTDGFTCTEMQEGKSWTYQTDLFCVCATVHVLLFGEYMQVNKKYGSWEIKQKFPRYLNKTVWGEFFPKLLNIPDKDNLPNLMDLKFLVDNETNENELTKHIRTVSNLIRKR